MFQIKRGSTLPVLRMRLVDSAGQSVATTSVTSAQLRLRPERGGVTASRALTLEEPRSSGWMRYAFVSGDWADPLLAENGRYQIEAHVTYSTGDTLGAPTIGTDIIVIQPSL
jgi:hypothetical protein